MSRNTPKLIVQDPVCHMDVDSRTTRYETEHEDRLYYFCSRMCLNEFENQPQQFTTTKPQGSVHDTPEE